MKYLGEIEKSMNSSIITYYIPFNVKDNDLISKIKIKISIYITFNLGET